MFVFTDHGVFMLSSVLNRESVVAVNIHMMRVYNKMRELMLTHSAILKKLAVLESLDKNKNSRWRYFSSIFNSLTTIVNLRKHNRVE